MSNPVEERSYLLNRRAFLSKSSLGIGTAALSGLLGTSFLSSCSNNIDSKVNFDNQNALSMLHFAPKAKRIIYLFQSGGPSQLELYDYKPLLHKLRGQELPESIRQGQRLTGMTSGQDNFPLASSLFSFDQYGQNGAWMSELLPYTSKIVDDICIVKSM